MRRTLNTFAAFALAALALLLLAFAPLARAQVARPGDEQTARVVEIQSALREAGLDGWLFCDFRHSDPLAYRILKLPEGGVTTLEIKSGYGLDLDSEVKSLKVARRLGETLPLSVVTTFLGGGAQDHNDDAATLAGG